MNVITLKSVNNGVFKVKILSFEGKTSYREFSVEELQQYIFDAEAYAEYHSLPLPKFVIPEVFKKVVGKWFTSLAASTNVHTNE